MSNSSAPLLLWQSFDYPTDTLLPGAKLGYDKRTQKKSVLTSWKHFYDPAPGLFSLELDPKHGQFVLKWKRTTRYWASGSWNGRIFSSVPDWLNTVYNYSYTDNENELYFTYSPFNRAIASRWNMGLSGQVQQLSWSDSSIAWTLLWSLPRERCEVYASCGTFGVCSNANASCNCLSGFKPRSTGDWNSKNYSGGCVRIGKLQCSDIAEDNDSFWMNFTMRLPIPQYTNVTVEDASQWDLFNLEQLSEDETGRTIFVKRGSPEG
uniref:G-type lectin S-receptor-like serine/threonine-protein kinase At2g19130 n=1 Tax=Nicotiana sylvestris TaxID=4096 RepID=A0A1U7YDI2_NICSY|nr:PREDICTED: G-type lectin S-receptor-like serine/threonine-protein kinase At2g19130 [Nicotiana sylvestris]